MADPISGAGTGFLAGGPVGALVGGGLGLLGGLFGLGAQSDANAQASKQRAQALKQWLDLNVPDPEAQKIYLAQMKSAGQLTPEMEQTVLQGNSAMKSISTDPGLKDAQLSALRSLQEVGESGGLDVQDQANLAKIQSNEGAREKGSRDALMQSMRSRGMAGSGVELAAALSGSDAAAARASEASLDVASQARARALQAMSQQGTLAGQIQGQQFNQAADVAKSEDAISRFNAQNSQATQQRNVAEANTAQQYNLTNTQRIADKNVDIANQQEKYNKELIQQNFENQARKTTGAANALTGNATATENQGKQMGQAYAGIGSGLAQAGSAYDNWYKPQPAQPAPPAPPAQSAAPKPQTQSADAYDLYDKNKRTA